MDYHNRKAGFKTMLAFEINFIDFDFEWLSEKKSLIYTFQSPSHTNLFKQHYDTIRIRMHRLHVVGVPKYKKKINQTKYYTN